MKNENQAIELELPQIRQMVLENSRRIERNELMINEMRMKQREEEKKQREEEQKRRERECYWDVAREEHERAHREHQQDMREIREIMRNQAVWFDTTLKKNEEERKKAREEVDASLKKHREDFDESLKKHREEVDESQKKHREDFDESLKMHREEVDASLKKHREEFDESLKKSKEEREAWQRRFEEDQVIIDKKIKETQENINKLSTEFRSAVGHIVEGLLGPSGHKMFMDAGFPVDRYCKDMYRKIKALNLAMEVDVLSYGEDLAIATEVKTNCTKKDIDTFLNKMKNFKEIFTEHSKKEVIAAIAAVNFDQDAYEYAKQQGILIIHVKDNTVFTLDPVPDKSVLRRF
ncbi:MAG: hypothetical protein J6T87_11110 [Bacteroidales bacterium]|nr:hypothetical protein [Bacteroidales bacterium]